MQKRNYNRNTNRIHRKRSALKLAELQSTVKRLNQRIAEIEKQGLQSSSNWYRYLQTKAFDDSKIFKETERATYEKRNVNGKDKFVNTGEKHESFKIRTDVTKMNKAELKQLYILLEETNKSHTSTISDIKKVWSKRYDTFKDTFKKETGNDYQGTLDMFTDLWNNNTYRAIVKKFGYSTTQELISQGLSNGLDINTIIQELSLADSISNAITRLTPQEMQEQNNVNANDDDWQDVFDILNNLH